MPRVCFIRLCLFVVALALGGCLLPTAHTRMAQQLDGYLGGGIAAMTQDLGTPTVSRQRADEGWEYAWRGCRLAFDYTGEQWPRYCEITAWADADGIVKHWNWWGNECPLEGVASGCHGMLWWQK